MKNKKVVVDESLTLKEKEWNGILASTDLEYIKGIIKGAKGRRDKARADKILKKKKLEDKQRSLVRSKLGAKARKFREDLVKNQTPSEARFKVILKLMGIKYEFQKIFYTKTSFYIPDFYLPDYNVVIELDGEYHNPREQRIKDNKRTKELKQEGVVEVFRLKNASVENIDIAQNLVKQFLAGIKKVNE